LALQSKHVSDHQVCYAFEISTFAWPCATLLVLALRLSTACQPVNMSLGNCVVTTSRTFFHPLHVLLKKTKTSKT
jgi:hypothetical protein